MTGERIYLLSTAILPEELIGAAADKNMTLEAKPYIEVEPIGFNGPGLFSRALPAAFTSANAVEIVAESYSSASSRPSGLASSRPSGPAWKIYCTAGATFEAVAAAFGADIVAGRADSAAALAEVILRQEQPGELLFFCGDRRRDELPLILTRAGFTVLEQPVYRTLLTPHHVDKEYAAIAFFSPSAVESFFTNNATQTKAVMFAIGPSTAEAIRSRCSNPVIRGDLPDKPALIRKMFAHFDESTKSK